MRINVYFYLFDRMWCTTSIKSWIEPSGIFGVYFTSSQKKKRKCFLVIYQAFKSFHGPFLFPTTHILDACTWKHYSYKQVFDMFPLPPAAFTAESHKGVTQRIAQTQALRLAWVQLTPLNLAITLFLMFVVTSYWSVASTCADQLCCCKQFSFLQGSQKAAHPFKCRRTNLAWPFSSAKSV